MADFNSSAANQQQYQNPYQMGNVNDTPGCLMNGLCFIIPLVGIIMYFVKKDSMPICAKSYLKWALIGVAVCVVGDILLALMA